MNQNPSFAECYQDVIEAENAIRRATEELRTAWELLRPHTSLKRTVDEIATLVLSLPELSQKVNASLKQQEPRFNHIRQVAGEARFKGIEYKSPDEIDENMDAGTKASVCRDFAGVHPI